MAASKRLIQLGSRLRAIHVGSTTNTHMPPLRRTSVNSYRFFFSSSSSHESECGTKKDQQGLELASLRSEITKLQIDIGKMREALENMDKVLHLKSTKEYERAEANRRMSERDKDFKIYGLSMLVILLLITLFVMGSEIGRLSKKIEREKARNGRWPERS